MHGPPSPHVRPLFASQGAQCPLPAPIGRGCRAPHAACPRARPLCRCSRHRHRRRHPLLDDRRHCVGAPHLRRRLEPPAPSRLLPWLPVPMLCCLPEAYGSHDRRARACTCLHLLMATGTVGAARKGHSRDRHFAGHSQFYPLSPDRVLRLRVRPFARVSWSQFSMKSAFMTLKTRFFFWPRRGGRSQGPRRENLCLQDALTP